MVTRPLATSTPGRQLAFWVTKGTRPSLLAAPVPATDPATWSGEPVRSAPVAMSMACSQVAPLLSLSLLTRYMVLLAASIAGVLVVFSAELVSWRCHSGAPPASASKA